MSAAKSLSYEVIIQSAYALAQVLLDRVAYSLKPFLVVLLSRLLLLPQILEVLLLKLGPELDFLQDLFLFQIAENPVPLFCLFEPHF